MRILTLTLSLLLFTACSKSSSNPQPANPAPTEPAVAPDASGRPGISKTDCESQGGEVVGDIGDGAIHRPDYVCPAGAPPIGSITAQGGEAIAVEGAVCCKKAQ